MNTFPSPIGAIVTCPSTKRSREVGAFLVTLSHLGVGSATLE
jgi:hypothetical protein